MCQVRKDEEYNNEVGRRGEGGERGKGRKWRVGKGGKGKGGRESKERKRERERRKTRTVATMLEYILDSGGQNKRRTKDNVLIFNPPMYGWI